MSLLESGSPVPFLRRHANGVGVSLHVQPRASRTEIVGVFGERLKVAVSGPPVDGKANAALCKFLGKKLGVAKSSVTLVRGTTGRQKELFVQGVTLKEVLAILPPSCF